MNVAALSERCICAEARSADWLGSDVEYWKSVERITEASYIKVASRLARFRLQATSASQLHLV